MQGTTLVVGGKTEGTSGHEDTHIIIKDDTTPMVKKGAEKTADAAKKVGSATEHAAKKTVDAVKNTDVKVKDDTHVEIHKEALAIGRHDVLLLVQASHWTLWNVNREQDRRRSGF